MKKTYLHPTLSVIRIRTQYFLAGSIEKSTSDDTFDPENMSFTRRRMWDEDEEEQ